MKELYSNISKSCGVLTVFDENEKISEGTCFCVFNNGKVFTAAHVVTGRYPICQRDVRDPNVKYFVKFPGIPCLEYKVDFCAITIRVEAFSEPVQLDMAVLLPKQSSNIEFPTIKINLEPPYLGEEVFIAGYSDELKLPFEIDQIIDSKYNGVKEFLDSMDKGYMADMTGPLIKRAVVGNHRMMIATDSKLGLDVSCDILYLDNGIHSGASGGPVVNKSNEVVGIITQRAVTSASQSIDPNLVVPSGSSIAISLQPLKYVNAVRSKL